MMLDALAERYGKLPSEVLERASTLDLWVYDTAISYRNYTHDKQAGNISQPIPTTEDLQKNLEAFRAQQGR